MDRQLFVLRPITLLHMSCDEHSFCAKILETTESFLVYTYGLRQHHMIKSNSMPIWLPFNFAIYNVHKELLYKTVSTYNLH